MIKVKVIKKKIAMGIKFNEFDVAHGCWQNYIERFCYCLEAGEIDGDAKRKANFLAVCGPDLYDLIVSLVSPKKISEVTFVQIAAILDGHFHPKLNEIVESYKFHTRNQDEGEKMRDYIAQLRKLSIHCNFTDLNRTLRDRLVCGIGDKDIQKKLLQQSKLTWEQACEVALSYETANIDANVIVQTGPSTSGVMQEVEPMEINKFTSKKGMKEFNNSNCFRCGKQHKGECRFRWSKCRHCEKTGHIEAACLVKAKQIKHNSDCNGLYEVGLNSIRQDKVKPFQIKVLLNDTKLLMEVDSGCPYTLINENTARLIWTGKLPPLKTTDVGLRSYTDGKLALLGQTSVEVKYKNMNKRMEILITKGNGTSLIGRNWFPDLGIIIQGINNVKITTNEKDHLKQLVSKYKEVFEPGLGEYTGPIVNITPNEGSVPKFLRSRPVAFAQKKEVFKEIDRLVGEDVLEPTTHSEWATPIVVVPKPNGKVRLCGDYRSTVNEVTNTDTYPLPTLNEAFAELQGGVIFSKIDLEQAYTQVRVDDKTAKLLTLNTPKGLYKVKRLAFGVKACPGIFQRLMSSLLAGIQGTAVLLDDIVISGSNMKTHNTRLQMVLQRLQEAGLRVNKGKCAFAVPWVQFLGFVIDQSGIHPTKQKIDAIEGTPAPENVKELQAFLGLLNFYDRFLPHKATIAEPLYRLLEKGSTWTWNKKCQEAFGRLKAMLSSKDTLVHYDGKKKLIMSCDASEYGLGAVLEHEIDDGTVRPIMFASRTMNVHERNYAQIDKEAAAIIFGLKKFHQYISGRKLLIKTDHRPLLGIFGPGKPIPNVISPRMLRWALLLNSYDYEIQYVEGKKLGNADALSRWPSKDSGSEVEEEYAGVLLLEETPVGLDVTAVEVARLTKKDQILSKICFWIRNGWPSKVDKEYQVFWQKRAELSVHSDCILWGSRVVIPEKMRSYLLEELHKNHDGIVITKALARSYFWWPSIDKMIEEMVKSCNICLENRNMPTQVTHHWVKPDKAWSRLHIDYAGPFQGKTFLILIDAYSKWPEVRIVNDLSSCTLIRTLRDIFAEQGLPDSLVSDNGRSFVSEEFKNYLKGYDIKQILVAPYHPASNGQAERTVQTVKNKLKKRTAEPWHVRLPNMLYGLRATPNTVNEKTPAELLNNRRFRTKFDSLNPLSNSNKKEKTNMDVKVRSFDVGQTVYVRNYNRGPRWLKGVVEKRAGVCRYLVRWNGKLLTRHINQMQSCGARGIEQQLEAQESGTEEDSRIIIPSPRKWAEIIGVTGPQEVVIPSGTTSSNKRALSTSPLSTNKKIRSDTQYSTSTSSTESEEELMSDTEEE